MSFSEEISQSVFSVVTESNELLSNVLELVFSSLGLSESHQKSKFQISFESFSFVSLVSSDFLLGISKSKENSQSSCFSSLFSFEEISISTSTLFDPLTSVFSWFSFQTELKSKSHKASLFSSLFSCAASQELFSGISNVLSGLFQFSTVHSLFCSVVISEKSKSKLSSVGLEILSNFSKLSKTSCEPPNSGFLASLVCSVDDTWFAELFAAVGLISAISFSSK